MNLNKLFEKYARKNIALLRKGGEDALNILYEGWQNSFSEELGCTPREYLKRLSVPELIEHFKEEVAGGAIGGAVVAELERRDSEKALKLFIKESDNDDAVMTAAEILERKNCAPEVDIYLDIVKDKSRNVDLREEFITLLKSYAKEVAPYIYPIIDEADIELKTIYAEILICAPQDERTYNLLTELFVNGDNIPLYCSYIGAYGDERAVAMLYRALDKANYADFAEISNAIERLGGTVDYEMKDFTEDPTFRKIKEGHNS